MKLKFLLSFFLLSFMQANAQYTNVINSNKPGFSESPYSVGTGVYQLESSVFFTNITSTPTLFIPESLGADFLFRTSFFLEKLELNAQIAYQKDKILSQTMSTPDFFQTGISKLAVGAKYLVYEQKFEEKSKEIRSWKKRFAYDWKRLIPSVAVYAGANIDAAVSDLHKTGSISPKVGVLLQNDLSSDLNIITNFFYDKIGTNLPEFSYIVTGTYSLNDRWSTFIENQGAFDSFQSRSNFGTGLAFLYNPNLQINSSLRLVTEAGTSGYYASFGVSYRYNRHKDEVIFYDENGNIVKKDPNIKYDTGTRGFFSRIFNIFKKKDKRKAEDTTGKRTRPKRVRKRPSSSKKKKKGFFSKLFGKKKKKPKKKETETEKLEREIKELEEELEKEDKKNKKTEDDN